MSFTCVEYDEYKQVFKEECVFYQQDFSENAFAKKCCRCKEISLMSSDICDACVDDLGGV
jgi:hypothetical protein